MANDLIFRVGETRRIAHEVESETAFAVSSVTCTIWDSGGNVIVNAGSGGTDSATSTTEHEVWYLWNTTGVTPDDHRYALTWVTGGQTFIERGQVILLSQVSKYDAYVERVIDWLVDAEMGEAQRALSWRQLRDCATTAIRRYSADRPRRLQADQVLASNTWEYALPSGWTNSFSHLEQVEYPVDASVQTRVFYAGQDVYEDEIRAKWMMTRISPATGETARLTYTVPHTLADATDTVPTHHFHHVTQFAAGLALEQLANRAAGTTQPNIGADMAIYRTRQQEYRAQARVMKEEAPKLWGKEPTDRPFANWEYMPDHGKVLTGWWN